ncbi:glycogen/starch/alpha-glucan phosphorylase [Elusimicrobiota bacterium]
MKKTAAKTKNSRSSKVQVEDDRTGLSIETLKRAIMDNLFYVQARFPAVATHNDHYLALAYTVRDRLLDRWLHTAKTYSQQGSRTVCYFSAEFLTGPHLATNLINLGIYDKVRQAVEKLDLNLEELLEQEEEPGLGNGGLGRLAACYLDSMATLEIPSIGYGIRYEFGIFDQEIHDGWQVEVTDKWLRLGNPWEIPRPENRMDIKFGGRTETFQDQKGRHRVRWIPDHIVMGMPYDTPILGYRVNTANLLRLWKAEACESFDFQAFNVGDYYGAVTEKMHSENITKVLYPNDEQVQGKELRLEQQYFFVACSLKDMIRIYRQKERDMNNFHKKYVVQLNDTHPSIAVAELMRLLVDENLMGWEEAWEITRKTLCFTNHTLLSEALEKWPIELFGRLLPRHLEIIFEINRRFIEEVRVKYAQDIDRLARMSIVDETGERYLRMANLACVGSHAINGVADLHTELLKKDVLKDFHELWPEKFSNKTNGVTPRRWMVLSNPRLTRLITETIGDKWINNLDELKRLEPFSADKGFREKWQRIKREIKNDLAGYILKQTRAQVNPDSIFDIQVKRIHEYKRQHLNAFHIITMYNRIKRDPDAFITPRTFIFGGKAAPAYHMAKMIIKLINSVGDVVNKDPDVKDRLKVVFLPNFCVTLGQQVYPACDLSEQVSTAGKEASGTGNMKFSLNGALTIGTLDGANIEIREEVGDENFFLFGLTAQEVSDLKAKGYEPKDYYNADPELKEVIDQIASGYFSPNDPGLFKPLIDSLMNKDEYMLLADYTSYIKCQERVGISYRDQDNWTRMAILNTARMGKFSSDRAIREYCQEIWNVKPVSIKL